MLAHGIFGTTYVTWPSDGDKLFHFIYIYICVKYAKFRETRESRGQYATRKNGWIAPSTMIQFPNGMKTFSSGSKQPTTTNFFCPLKKTSTEMYVIDCIQNIYTDRVVCFQWLRLPHHRFFVCWHNENHPQNVPKNKMHVNCSLFSINTVELSQS